MLPRKRVGKAQDLDAVLMMLCSNESHFVNGAVIAADDGFGLLVPSFRCACSARWKRACSAC
jgi:hypothetical protein